MALQAAISFADDEAEALAAAHRHWPIATVDLTKNQDLATPGDFDRETAGDPAGGPEGQAPDLGRPRPARRLAPLATPSWASTRSTCTTSAPTPGPSSTPSPNGSFPPSPAEKTVAHTTEHAGVVLPPSPDPAREASQRGTVPNGVKLAASPLTLHRISALKGGHRAAQGIALGGEERGHPISALKGGHQDRRWSPLLDR